MDDYWNPSAVADRLVQSVWKDLRHDMNANRRRQLREAVDVAREGGDPDTIHNEWRGVTEELNKLYYVNAPAAAWAGRQIEGMTK